MRAGRSEQSGSRLQNIQAQVQAGAYDVSPVLVAERMIDLALTRIRRQKVAAAHDTPEVVS